MKKFLMEFIEDESGATAIEYALIAAGISVVIIVSVNALGGEIDKIFKDIKIQLNP